MSDLVTMKLRRPVTLKKGGEPVTELELKPEGRALRGVLLSLGFKSENLEKVYQRHSVGSLACAGLRMAGVPGDRVKLVCNELHPSDAFTLFTLVRDLLMVSLDDAVTADEKAGTVTVRLRRPVQFGKTLEPVESITMEPTGGALRDLDMLVSQEGELAMMNADITELAKVGVRLGKVPGDMAIVDLMHPGDVKELAEVVLGFIQGGPQAGSDTSAS